MSRQSVYDQLKKLQTLPNAFGDWEDYRFELTNYILEETTSGTTALIVGAGACNDYDLERLAGHFSHITLLDLNEEEMKAAVKRQVASAEAAAKFSFLAGSITGIDEEDYRRFSDALSLAVNLYGSGTDIDALSKIATAEMERSFENRRDTSYLFTENTYDYVLCFGVHSQINSIYPWIWEAFLSALRKRDVSVHIKAREFNNILVKELNDNLLTASVNGILAGLEETRFGVGGAVEGASQGINDLNEKIKSASIDLISHRDALWPFNPDGGIVYNMKWIHVRKK